MGFIQNFRQLVKSPQRQAVLEIIEAGLLAIQPSQVIPSVFSLENEILKIKGEDVNLQGFKRIILIGFGKGSAAFSKEIEDILKNKLSEGYVIDNTSASFSKISSSLGSHPLPSEENLKFTQNLEKKFSGKLTQKDLVLIIICGGGSAMLVSPTVSLDQKIAVNHALLRSGANIGEMNTIRKHLSQIKGGGLAKMLYPAAVFTLIFSDVPGNDLSIIASGPTVLDKTTADDAWDVAGKYSLKDKLALKRSDLTETPKEEKYFSRVKNILALSNQTALQAMQEKAAALGYRARIYSDRLQGEAGKTGPLLISQAVKGEVLLAGGETTVKVKGAGEGGRNQEVALGALADLSDNTVIASFDSDGWDNSPFAGAISDHITAETAKSLHLEPVLYLNRNGSLEFYQKVGDGIITGKLPSNVADLFIVYKI